MNLTGRRSALCGRIHPCLTWPASVLVGVLPGERPWAGFKDNVEMRGVAANAGAVRSSARARAPHAAVPKVKW